MRHVLILACLLAIPACNPALRDRAGDAARTIAEQQLVPGLQQLLADALAAFVSALLGNGDGPPKADEAGYVAAAHAAEDAVSTSGLTDPAAAELRRTVATETIERLAGPPVAAGLRIQGGDERVPLYRLAARWLRAHREAWAR